MTVNVLDLESLRFTKQGMGDYDRQDLGPIEAALMALRGKVLEQTLRSANAHATCLTVPSPMTQEVGLPLALMESYYHC
ncbi:hypothetical protein [Methylobacterium sp. V23]|uniref:hypothetical protein n=1 Tax=Methylobacterium sp. V23 TaxID=2044878 RepID=UPI000CDAD4BF|nr:hypothetical protein [Methylobacterium sp. V23]POR39951.1 hypothetical protein CRT23_26625 [Methylobacterium sp. V23]